MTLNLLREEIDNIDNQILDLFLKRLQLCENIANLKASLNIPILNEKREHEVLSNISKKSGKYSDESKQLFSEIMSICKSIQYKIVKTSK